MKTDKNTIIGFVLLGILFIGFFWYNNKMAQSAIDHENKVKDSLAKVEASKITPEIKAKAIEDSIKRDSTNKILKEGNFTGSANGSEKIETIETDILKINFTNKGGRIQTVSLKKYNSYDSTPVVLGTANDKLGYNINTGNNAVANTNDLYFQLKSNQKNTDGSQTIIYELADSAGRNIQHIFTIAPNTYMIDWKVSLTAANQLLNDGNLNISWQTQTTQHEKSAEYERVQMSNICFLENKEFDYIMNKTEHTFEKPTNWMSVVQQFFNTTLVAENNFNSGNVKWEKHTTDTTKILANVQANFQIKITTAATNTIPLKMYFGPNDYNILKKQAPEMDRIVNLGRDMYSFVRPINQYIIMPVFNFFSSFIGNYGWVILLLTLFIRLITAPLTYSSYLSGAKMKVLRPELDALKKKIGENDKQAFAMEQMKLFREAGVNPLGGCIPALLQIPIFFALFSFFNSNIALRGENFLWAKDLSSYDDVISWGTNIWLVGNHISLFNITAVITSFLISIYNMGNTPTQDNPALKYMPYIFPFVLFFVFNKMPAALTWYYTVSNLVTLILQFIIQKYIIDHDKILAKIEAKRSNPKKQSKWQERYTQMVENQKKIQEMKNKTKK
ncbi:MAG TPA: membrane protein insertase YidC [Chitinophagaceae bacterium]|nr:membrane protein insertase YidC [Chitinophagaceae bacterium]HNN31412.1 membrane protein insertase YidC [Chitinophagaceae bacterium]